MRNLLRTATILGALLAGTVTALAQANPAVGHWTATQYARPNDPYVSYEVLLSPNGRYDERMIVNPGGVATYSGSWSFDPRQSVLSYRITQWDPIAIPPLSANQTVSVHVQFANGGYTMLMEQPGGVPIQFTRQN